jgi:SM-20-related protein
MGTGTGASWPIPPHVRIESFLSASDHRAILDWVLDHEGEFDPAKIVDDVAGRKGFVDPGFRVALTTRRLGSLGGALEKRMRDALPELERALGMKTAATSVELELAAHGDGAHYLPHIDISTGPGRKRVGANPGEDRILSAVYYFHAEPKRFSGGALRLFRLSARPRDGAVSDEDYVDLEPLQNSLLAFPSWASHEVRPVRCPTGRFRDYRFALNCWFCRKL